MFDSKEQHTLVKLALIGVLVILVFMLSLMVYWDSEPDSFDVVKQSQGRNQGSSEFVTGYVTTATLIEVSERLLSKRGGYLSNDMMPPSIFMDNIPAWEFGVLTQIRDMARAMRNDFSRSQTQSVEDKDLMTADPLFHIDSESWMFPAAESEYKKDIVNFHPGSFHFHEIRFNRRLL